MSIVNTLSPESNRQIKINFNGGDLSSDAGLLLIPDSRKRDDEFSLRLAEPPGFC